MIVRGNYRYRPEIHHNLIKYYKCEDFKTQGCKGVWRINVNEGPIGFLHIEHSIILEHHSFFKEM